MDIRTFEITIGERAESFIGLAMIPRWIRKRCTEWQRTILLK